MLIFFSFDRLPREIYLNILQEKHISASFLKNEHFINFIEFQINLFCFDLKMILKKENVPLNI